MKVSSKPFAKTWKLQRVQAWFTQQFPELCRRRSREDISDYLEGRVELACSLGFKRVDHWQYLIGYELDCGVSVLDAAEDEHSSAVRSLIRQREMPPAQRIDSTERLLYGVDDDGSEA